MTTTPIQNDAVLLHAAYATYLLISVAMTIWVARALSSSGETFLVRCFGQDVDLARSTNRLLVIGFYLLNLGFISMRLDGWNLQYTNLIGELGARIGIALLVLGAMHFFNMMMIARMGRTIRRLIGAESDAPTAPTGLHNELGKTEQFKQGGASVTR
ncbi:hypothetical protein [Piscinibacterium candidicorallinum]|uniref:Integral membrane protein n=1 Tax=Piscinibacterium candidicorallinum TaxID=1793872 RepID=A0ABV7H5D2_9BURK